LKFKIQIQELPLGCLWAASESCHDSPKNFGPHGSQASSMSDILLSLPRLGNPEPPGGFESVEMEKELDEVYYTVCRLLRVPAPTILPSVWI